MTETTQPKAKPAEKDLHRDIFVAVLAALASRGMPPQEAASIALTYANAGITVL